MHNSILDIKEILNDYSQDIQEGIVNETQTISKKAKDELKATSPKRTGKYSKGWRVTTKKGKSSIECVVHNATDYQLTHLLEKPHALRNGKSSIPKVHIAPVEQKYVKEYEKNIERIIQNGG